MAKPASDLVHNERTKLLANALDRASTAALAVGVLGPIVGFTFGDTATAATLPLSTLALSTILWLAIAFVLHLAARTALGRLR